MSELRYLAAAIQTDLDNPASRCEMTRNTSRMITLIDQAVIGYRPFGKVRLVVFPEFAHSAPVFPKLKDLRDKLGIEIPNGHTDRLWKKAQEHDIYIQSGSMLEVDDRYPKALFNTTCLIGPEGILLKYRKVYPWVPWEVHTSPHDIEGYTEEVFPVADTPIGKLGVAICYDWLFPEALRQLTANGAEVLIRVSAYMDPWGATNPSDWWTIINRCRALENTAYVVAANQAASIQRYPPFSWPGGSMVVDHEGRVVAQATPGDGTKIVVGAVDVDAVRQTRRERTGHQMIAHLRTEAHPMYQETFFPAGTFKGQSDHTYDDNEKQIEAVKEKLGY